MGGLALALSGWGSICSFSLLGGIRALVQFVSYEVVMSFFLFGAAFAGGGFFSFELGSKGFGLLAGILLIGGLLVTLVAEVQRNPFDFAEGESELVSGFNTEYSSLVFSLIFLREYGMLAFWARVFSLVAFSGGWFTRFVLAGLLVRGLIVSRGSFPRLRFDVLQGMV